MQTAMKRSAIGLALVLIIGGAIACAQQPEKKANAEAPQTETTQAEPNQQAASEAPATGQEAEAAAVSEPAAEVKSEEAAPAPADAQKSEQEGANAPKPVN